MIGLNLKNFLDKQNHNILERKLLLPVTHVREWLTNQNRVSIFDLDLPVGDENVVYVDVYALVIIKSVGQLENLPT